jgi:hypothetical protein
MHGAGPKVQGPCDLETLASISRFLQLAFPVFFLSDCRGAALANELVDIRCDGARPQPLRSWQVTASRALLTRCLGT